MTKVAHDFVASTRSEVEALARRLLALRSDIDTVLVGLASTQPPAVPAQVNSAAGPVMEAGPASPTQITDDFAPAEPPAGQECMANGEELDPRQCACGEAQPCDAACSVDGIRPAFPASDDLTLIRGVDEALAEDLNSLGIATFAQIANWSKPDVARMSKALGLGRRICKENWIEQAAMLASGRVTAFARGPSAGASRSIWEARHAPARDRDTDVLACERNAQPCAPAPVADEPCDSDDLQPVRATETPPPAPDAGKIPAAPVLSLAPFRGTPGVPVAARVAKARPAHHGLALAMKLAACLLALAVAGLAMVGRENAWGSASAPRIATQALRAGTTAGVAGREVLWPGACSRLKASCL